MRCTRFGFLALCLLGVAGRVRADGVPAPKKTEPARTASDLKPGDGDEVAGSLGRINSALRTLYRRTSVTAGKPAKMVAVIMELLSQLNKLEGSDAAIRKLGTDDVAALVRLPALRDRAQAWLHAWATFSLLTIEASRSGSDAEERLELLALDRPPTQRSALALLLTVYRQIRVAEDNRPEPLRVRLQDGSRFFFELAYKHPWREGERPALLKHDRYIPAAADLVGDPDAPPRLQRELLSLWALVNLQLDTWRAQPDGKDPCGFFPLAQWLKQLKDNPDLTAFNQAPADRKLGEGLSERVDRLQRFLAFRAACARDSVLQDLLTELKNARNTGKAAEHVELKSGLRMQDLVAAARPLGGESLPQAEIWLRYVLLLSYQGEGVDVLADRARKGNGIDPFWRTTGLSQPFLMPPPKTEDDRNTAPELLRWGKWPRQGHFVRAAADATQAAYHYALWEAQLERLEKLRFQSVNDTAARRRYGEELDAQVREVKSLLATHLDPYVGPLAPLAQCAPPEYDRLYRDLDALSKQAASAARIQGLVLRAVRTGDPTTLATTLQGMAGFDGLARWDVNAFPTKTFADYADGVRRAVARLEADLKSFQWRQELRERFAARKEQTEILEAELAAAQLGLEIARQGKQIADVYEKIAKLGVEIKKLEGQANLLLKQAAGNQLKSTELRLTLANQARDLAAAQVEALEQATAHAEQMVEQAAESLKAMQGQLLAAADRIEEQKRRSGFLSILRAVVNVVGVALAPFTGGASVAVAQAANMAINIYEKVSTLDFKNLGQAALQLASLTEDIGAFASLTVNKLGLGGAWGKQALADVKGWVKRAETNLNRLGDKARPVLDGLKKLGQSEVGQFLSVLASDIPISLSDGKLKVDLGKVGIKFKDAALKRIWGGLLQQGGMIVNDLQARARLAKLHLAPDDQYREELRKAVDELIRVCPQAALVHGDLKEATRQVEQRKAELKTFIDQADAAQRKFLGQMFNGWVVVKDAKGELVAVERSLTKEAAAFRERVEHYRQQVATGVIERLADDIRKRNGDLESLARDAAKERDETRLRKLAREQVPQQISGLAEKLEELRRELVLARGKLKDAETQTEIAGHDERAARAMAEAAKLKVEGGELSLRKAFLAQTAKAMEVRRAELQIRQEEFRLQAARWRVERSQAELRRLYAAARRWGVNPLNETTPSRLALDGILTVYDADDPDRLPRGRLVLDRMAGELIGMVQWVRLLNLAPKGYVGDSRRFALDQFTRILGQLSRAAAPQEVGQALGKIAADLQKDFDTNLNIPPENLRFVRAVAIDPKALQWFEEVADPDTVAFPSGDPAKTTEPLFVRLRQKGDGQFQQLVNREVLNQLPARLRPRALGYFKFRFSLDPKIRLAEAPGFAGVGKAPSRTGSYYFFLQESSLVRERQLGQPGLPIDDLRFYCVPSLATPNPGLPLSPAPDRAFIQQAEGKQLNDQLEEEQRLSEIRNRLKLWREFRLTPAVGDWTIFLLESTDLTDAERRARIQESRGRLVLTLRIPYLQVPAPVSD